MSISLKDFKAGIQKICGDGCEVRVTRLLPDGTKFCGNPKRPGAGIRIGEKSAAMKSEKSAAEWTHLRIRIFKRICGRLAMSEVTVSRELLDDLVDPLVKFRDRLGRELIRRIGRLADLKKSAAISIPKNLRREKSANENLKKSAAQNEPLDTWTGE